MDKTINETFGISNTSATPATNVTTPSISLPDLPEISQIFPHISIGLLKLTPHVEETLWGGSFFSSLYNLPSSSRIGETWELAMFDSEPIEKQTLIQGMAINDFIGDVNKYNFWGPEGKNSYVIKYIDTSLNLSVQVHPDDFWCKRHGHKKEKNECWIILNTEKGAGLYLGIKDQFTFNDFEHAVLMGLDLKKYLNFIEVNEGDFFVIPAGLIHSIGEGIRLLEIQQNSNVTYRVWDWNRTDKHGVKRELHAKQALDVISSNMHLNYLHGIQKQEKIWDIINNTTTTNTTTITTQKKLLIKHDDFSVDALALMNGSCFNLSLEKFKRPVSLLCLKGEAEILRGEEKIKCNPYETILMPHNGYPLIQILSKDDCNIAIVY
ncbi:MAG: class I mannose-6-phosphate isomerase [Oligoflexia bacterium]|nr:class I mannose-6-phosphate isomerase [Oligoflexia bacterium]